VYLFRFHHICTVDDCLKIKRFPAFGTDGTDERLVFYMLFFLYIFYI